MSSPTAPAQSNAPQTSRFGFFNKFTRQARGHSVSASVQVAATTASAVAVRTAPVTIPTTPAPQLPTSPADSTTSSNADILKHKAENEQLRNRCAELTEQSKLNQDMLQECISGSNTDIDNLISEVSKLKQDNKEANKPCTRCDELVQQSQLNQEMLAECTFVSKIEVDKLTAQLARQKLRIFTSETQVQRLINQVTKLESHPEQVFIQCTTCDVLNEQFRLNQDLLWACTKDSDAKDSQIALLKQQLAILRSNVSDMPADKAEIKTLRAKVSDLEARLDSQVTDNRNLQLAGFAPAPEFDQFELLSRIETLETDDLGLQDALDKLKSKTKSLVLEYSEEANDLTDKLRTAKTDAKYYHQRATASEALFRSAHTQYTHLAGELQVERTANALLLRGKAPVSAQLTKFQTLASDRQTLITALQAQQKQIEAGFAKDEQEKVAQYKHIDQLHADNNADRKRFEATLVAKDARISDVELKLRNVQVAAKTRISMQAAAAAKVEDEFKRRLEVWKAEFRERANKKIRWLEGNLRRLRRETLDGEGLCAELMAVVGGRGSRGESLDCADGSTQTLTDVSVAVLAPPTARLAPSVQAPLLTHSPIVYVHVLPVQPDTPPQSEAQSDTRSSTPTTPTQARPLTSSTSTSTPSSNSSPSPPPIHIAPLFIRRSLKSRVESLTHSEAASQAASDKIDSVVGKLQKDKEDKA
jgi:hypothetical protein